MGAMTGDEVRRLRWSLGFASEISPNFSGCNATRSVVRNAEVLPVHDQIALLIQLRTAKSPSPSPTANAS